MSTHTDTSDRMSTRATVAIAATLAVLFASVGTVVVTADQATQSTHSDVCTAHSTQQQCLPGLVAQDDTAAYYPLASRYTTWVAVGQGYTATGIELF